MERTYLCIDLKSFYASCECVERGLDPLTTNLVVADKERTEKTICLAVTPSLKSYGISGRARLFEVVSKVKEVNRIRESKIDKFLGESYNDNELKKDKFLKLTYLVAPPRMAYYMDYSARIFNIYLKYVDITDIHVYSIDEVFMDITNYIGNGITAYSFARRIIKNVIDETGITATAGIGENLYLAKIAMDVEAKHIKPDKSGVRIATLNKISFREKLWDHLPITDFWRIGKGYQKRLNDVGIYTMGDIAKCSVGGDNDFYNEDLLYKIFGVNAELLIDHAWGYEPVTIKDIKSYKPDNKSLGSGQVLSIPYGYEKTKTVVKEMTELLVLELVSKKYVTNQVVLTIGYDRENLLNPDIRNKYKGEIKDDGFGRKIPKPDTGRINLKRHTSSRKEIIDNTVTLFERIMNKDLIVRRLNLSFESVISEDEVKEEKKIEQLDFFTDYKEEREEEQKKKAFEEKERHIQETIIELKNKFGKNAVLKGMNLKEGATTIERNNKIGGHKA